MRARLNQQIQRLRQGAPRRGHELVERPVGEPAPPAPLGAEARVRGAGGPDDRAQYTCSCGLAFTAPVSTSVACPHCGADQAW